VLIDRKQGGWFLFSVIAVAASAWVYVAFARDLPGGPRGSSAPGLAFGVLASLAMLFAGVLGLRKRLVRQLPLIGLVPRLGSLEFWMKGHLWLGLLTVPWVAFHAGFSLGGSLTTTLAVLLLAVVVTGLVGAVLQHYLPHALTQREQGQTTHEQFDRRRWNVVSEAQGVIRKACEEALKTAREANGWYRAAHATRATEVAALPEADRPKREPENHEKAKAYERAVLDAQAALERTDAPRDLIDAARPGSTKPKPMPRPPAAAQKSRASLGTKLAAPASGPAKTPPDPSTLVAPAELVAFYCDVALPFLLDSGSGKSPLEDELAAEILFEATRQRVPEPHRVVLLELRGKCDAVRRKARSQALYVLLHGWLLVHVPLAMVLIVLAAIHAVKALRY
jgi:hypothetical protein